MLKQIAAYTLIGSGILLAAGALMKNSSESLADSPRGDGVAVVELFTSEGCSSCPPADAALAELVENAAAHGSPVFPIAFHVDYWDRLGWKDPFSTAAASDRQNRYAQAFGTTTIYTPQMIVNGRVEFVGSDRARAKQEIAAALKAAPTATLSLKIGKRTEKELSIAYTAAGAPADTLLTLVVVERGLSTQVPRGENAGSLLKHENVARAFDSIPITAAKGDAKLPLPPDLKADHASVIGYLQNAKTMQVLHAVKIDLDTPTTKPATK